MNVSALLSPHYTGQFHDLNVLCACVQMIQIGSRQLFKQRLGMVYAVQMAEKRTEATPVVLSKGGSGSKGKCFSITSR